MGRKNLLSQTNYSFKITFAEELKLRENLFRFPCFSVALEINFHTDMQTCYSDIGCLCICKAIFTMKQMQSKSSYGYETKFHPELQAPTDL